MRRHAGEHNLEHRRDRNPHPETRKTEPGQDLGPVDRVPDAQRIVPQHEHAESDHADAGNDAHSRRYKTQPAGNGRRDEDAD